METNFNQPQRQSSVGILVMFIDSLQKFGRAFFPLILIFIFKSDKFNLLYLILMISAVLLFVGVVAYLKYINFTFYIDDENDEFIIQDGIVNKTKTTIQLNKIQQVNINQSLIQRLIGVYALEVDTAGSDNKEGSIKAVSHSLALALKAKLLENTHKTVPAIDTENAVETAPEIGSPFLKIDLISLIKVGITSNYVKSIGLLLTFFFTIMENLENIGKDDVINEDQIESFITSNSVWYSALMGILIMFTIIFVINIARTVIKYFNYTIAKQKGSLLLSYGLINTKSTIVKPEKVQMVTVTRNYFQKKLNVLEIRIKQAVRDEKQHSKSQIEVPGCNKSEKNEIIKLIFKQLPIKDEMLKPNFRKLGFSIFMIIIVPLSGFFIIAGISPKVMDYSSFVFVYTAFFLIILIFGFRNYRLFVSDNHIIKQSGAWDIDNEIIEIDKIQAVSTSQLFWHKSLNIGSLTLHTAGGNVSFQLGNYKRINELVNLWLYKIETSNSNWM